MTFDMGNFLAHEYDAAKAKEYYERTKKLKGRKKGRGLPTPVGRPTATAAPARQPSKAVAKTGVKPVTATNKRAAELKARLGRLEEILDSLTERVKAAQARSGIESQVKKSTDTKKSADSTPEKASKKTSSEKKADAKAAAERYEKNKNPETSKNAQAVQDEIERVQKEIADARAELTAALQKLRDSSKKPKPKPGTAIAAPVKNKEGDRQNGA